MPYNPDDRNPATSEPLDWSEISRRLDKTAQHDLAENSESRSAEILRERARALSTITGQVVRDDKDVRHFLVFHLAGGRYAIDLAQATEILNLQALTALPGAPPYVGGVINLRGSILMLVNLAKLYGLEREGIADLTKVIVIDQGNLKVGLLAESIEGICESSPNDIQPPVVAEAHIVGLIAGEIAILDVERLLGDKRLVG